MTNPNTPEDQEAPLDPALEKVRRKMIRLLIISSSVIILGLMAVVFSVVYRVDKLDDKAKADATGNTTVASDIVPPAQQTLTLPAGFNVVSTAMDGNRILVIGVTPDGARRMYVHDIGTGQRLTEIEIK